MISRIGPLGSRLPVPFCLALLAACAGPNSNATSVRSQITVGERMLDNGDFGKGYALLDKVEKHNPRSNEAAVELANAYFRQNALLKAEAQYRKAIGLGAWSRGLVGIAKVNLARNNPEAAEPYLRKVLERDPGNVAALNAMGVACDLRGQHDKARQYYETILASSPSNKEALNNLSLSLALSGRPREAYPFIAELSRSNQDDRVVRQNLALIQYLSGDRERAMRTARVDLTEGQARQNFAQVSKTGIGL